MDRLIKADVQVLDFLFIRDQKRSHTFKLSNLMHTMPVAVSLTVSDPSIFSFSQPFSIIPPLSAARFTLHLTRPHHDPPLSALPATILVRSSMLPTGKAHRDDLRSLFSRPGPHIFKDAKIPVSLVGPDVAEFLLSPAASHHPPEINNSFFLKAISLCDESQLTSLLAIAARNGDPSSISALIESGADVNYRDSKEESLICLAVESGNANSVQILIEAGCEIDMKSNKLLHIAAAKNRVDLMEILCLGYADIDLDSVNSQGQTPLHISSIHSQIEALRFLISIGSNPDITDKQGWTPLHYAVYNGHSEAVELLLEHSSFAKYAVTNDLKTAFDLAVDGGHSNLYDLLHLGDMLHRSARLNDVHTMRSCIAQGAKVNGRDQNRWTPLHRAAFKGHMESVEILVNHQARIDVVDSIGYTPVLLAIEAGHVEIAMYLLSNGAKASLKSIKGMINSDDHEQCLKNHPSLLNPNQEKQRVSN